MLLRPRGALSCGHIGGQTVDELGIARKFRAPEMKFDPAVDSALPATYLSLRPKQLTGADPPEGFSKEALQRIRQFRFGGTIGGSGDLRVDAVGGGSTGPGTAFRSGSIRVGRRMRSTAGAETGRLARTVLDSQGVSAPDGVPSDPECDVPGNRARSAPEGLMTHRPRRWVSGRTAVRKEQVRKVAWDV
jgi:hypothetical protein